MIGTPSVVGMARIVIDVHSPVPSYQQLAAQLRAAIEAGEIAPRMPIPSIVTLKQETGLATGTIQRAVDVLKAAGMVYYVPGRGTYVAPRKQWKPDSGTPRQPGG